MTRRRSRSAAPPEVEARVERMRDHVMLEARDRPAVYRMIAPDGEIVYVGKAKRLRTRLLGYFRAAYPAEKSARVIREAGCVEWDYQPSEFAATLEELRAIKRWRPRLNVAMKRDAWHYAFVRVAPHAVPKFQVVRSAGQDDGGVYYGPFQGAHQIGEALRELNDVLGLRDCRLDLPMYFADQTELPVAAARTPGCIRHEIGKCAGPCIGAVTHRAYRAQFRIAVSFLEGAHDSPVATLRQEMETSSKHLAYERAAILRDRIARLESLQHQFARLRFAVESLTFVYTVPGFNEDDRAYIVSRGRVRAELPAPQSRADRKALGDRASGILKPTERRGAPVPAHEVDELLLLSSWFRKNPHELERTEKIRG